MTSEYRFIRTSAHGLAFASLKVEAQPGPVWEYSWNEDGELPTLRRAFGSAVEAGLEIARSAHSKLGGTPQRVTILAFGYNPPDTSPDAVECAAAVALWKALGYDQREARFRYEGGWKVELDS